MPSFDSGVASFATGDLLKATLRFSPKVLTHLGEALVPNADQAVLELVKNAFDADASTCTVQLDESDSGLTLHVIDNGNGMTPQELRDRWLLLGSSTKSKAERTGRFNRLPVGDKGLGRLAALRLGHSAEISTKSGRKGARPCTLDIDWSKYSAATAVDQVELEIKPGGRQKQRGTRIQVSGIQQIDSEDVDRLSRALALVSDPFRDSGSFSVKFVGTAVKNKASFTKKLFKLARYRIIARYDGGEVVDVKLIGRGNKTLNRAILKAKGTTVPFEFELWEFIMARRAFSIETYPFDEIKRWIAAFGGVHLFDGDIRIAPQTERPTDWLDMNLRRARSPEERPSTNNSIGRVVIDNSSGQIVQTTDRVSFFQNEAYHNLVVCCQQVLDWSAKVRVDAREIDRITSRNQGQEARKLRDAAIDVLEKELKPDQLSKILPAVESAFKVSVTEVESVRADNVLYRAMATAGITAVVFSHEIGHPLGVLRRRLPDIMKVLEQHGGALRDPIELVRQSVTRLSAYVDLPTRFSQRARRRTSLVPIASAVLDLVKAFSAIVAEQHIRIATSIDALDQDGIYGSRAMIDAIFANLFTNSVRAFRRGITKTPRRISLSMRRVGSSRDALITYTDNAGGLKDVALDEIWKPGITTTPGGTGFGLTIVRDTVTDLGGTIAATAKPSGLEFRVRLPVRSRA